MVGNDNAVVSIRVDADVQARKECEMMIGWMLFIGLVSFICGCCVGAVFATKVIFPKILEKMGDSLTEMEGILFARFIAKGLGIDVDKI